MFIDGWIRTARTLTMIGLVALGVSVLETATAWAACTAPDGAAGSLDYDPATKIRTICDGSAWKNLEEVDYSGDGARQRLQIAEDAGSCTSAKLGRLSYDGVAEWQYCDGTDWSRSAAPPTTARTASTSPTASWSLASW